MENFRELLLQLAEYEKNIKIMEIYKQCAFCEFLKEENNSVICSNCGCNILLKIENRDNCFLGKWQYE